MSFYIDIATLISVSAAFYIALLLLLFVFLNQNYDIDAIIWWCGFPLFRIINSLISSDTTQYDNDIFIYLGNISVILSDVFLMIGCLKFSELKISWPLIGVFVTAFLVSCFYQSSTGADLSTRTKWIVIFDVVPIFISIYALSLLANKDYALEKFFTIFWIAFQLAIFTFWILINFNFDNSGFGNIIIVSLAGVYLSHFFIIVGLIILAMAERKNQLLNESITHKKLELSLEKVLYAAQTANEEKNMFLTNMSHELRTPLNAIIGFSESLKLDFYGKLNEKQTEYVDNIYGGGELLLKLITDLLHLSNIEEGKVDILLEEINLNLLLTKTVPLLKEISGVDKERLKIINLIDETNKSMAVYIDQIRTKQILINFVSNAVKYSGDSAPIVLKIEELNDQFYRISVTDNGMGISEDHYANIFEPFNRAGNRESDIEGIGVGLSISKWLIEEMNGKIGFSSELNIGSTFWIDVPRSRQRQLPIGE